MTDVRFLERTGGGGPRIAWALDGPAGAARGAVLLTHGFGEHSGRYRHVVDAWTARGLLVASWDLRGHGRSEGTRGHVESYRDYVNDAEDVLAEASHDDRWRALGKPLIFGHSMGALVSTHLVLAGQSRYRALVMTSPFFGIARSVNPVQRAVGGLVSHVVPTLTQPAGLHGADLTHDAEIAAAYDADPLGLKRVTVGWFFATERAQQDAFLGAPHIKLPVFGLAAGDDRAASIDATRRFFAALGGTEKQLEVVEGGFHELMNEPERARHIGRVADALLAFSERE